MELIVFLELEILDTDTIIKKDNPKNPNSKYLIKIIHRFNLINTFDTKYNYSTYYFSIKSL